MNAVAAVKSRAHFVPMRETDLDAVTAAELDIYQYPWTRGNFGDALAAGYSAWVCREPDAEAILGYGVLMLVLDEAHLLNLSIVRRRQRQGYGSALLEHIFSVACQYGAKRMYLEVRESNAAGIALYERYAFARIGRRRGYYPGTQGREDAIVLARDL